MKKLLFTITIILAGFAYLQAETIITNPVIDGDTWVKENSPYLISLDIHIQNLIIEPGVEVLFSDNWTMTVDGSLIANGTFSDSITFMPAPANTQIWQGIVFKSSSYASVMRYCRIEATNKYAISVDACQPAISNCRLIDNTTGGLFIKNTSLSVNNSFFKGNGIAGVWLEKANLTILNSIFSQNGTALYLSNKSDILIASNCVLVNGTTGVRAPNAQVTIINSIIHSNATELDVNPEKTSVTYCCVEDGFPGLGNITADPLFFDQTRFRLQDPSPCKDAGNPAVNDEDRYFPPSLGNRRNDMGAYGGPYAYGWFPPLYIIPQSIAFSRVTQDSSKTAQILLKNYRGTGISILTITPDTIGTGTFAADPSGLYLPFSDSAYINVIFNPDSEKAYSSDLIFNTSTEGTVILPVSGRGVLPHLSTSTDSLNFGEITVNDSSKILVPLTNLGGDTLTVNLNVFQDNIFSVNPKQLTINPDSSTVYLEVTFTPRSAAAFYDSLVINSNDRSNSHLMLPLSGRGLSPLIHSNRNSLEFGEVNLFSPALQYLQISNLGNADLNIDAISVWQSDSGQANVFSIDSTLNFPIILGENEHFTLPIRFLPLQRGQVSSRINILSLAPIPDSISIDVHGTGIAPQLTSDISELDFGMVEIGQDSIQFLHLHNTGNTHLSINDMIFTDAESDKIKRDTQSFFYLDSSFNYPLVLENDSTLTVALRFSPALRGHFSSQFRIVSSDPEKPTVTVLLNGTGIDPEFNINVPDLDFGHVPIGEDSLQHLSLQNAGNSNLFISDLSLISSDDDTTISHAGQVFIIDSTLTYPIVLTPDHPVLIPLRFSPQWRGNIGARIKLSFAGTVMDSIYVSLSGTGIAPKLSREIAGLEFNLVEIGKTLEQSFKIYNTGNADLRLTACQFLPVTGDTSVFYLADSSLIPSPPVPPDSSFALTVGFNPLSETESFGTLVLLCNDPFKMQDSLELHGRGYKVYFPPRLTLSAGELDFGTVPPGYDSLRYVTVYNEGSDTLLVFRDSLFFSGPAKEDFSLAGMGENIVLTSGDSSDLYIRFHPLNSGEKQAVLHLISNDPQVSDTLISLTGRAPGIKPAVITRDDAHTTTPFTFNQPAILAVRIDSVSSVDSAVVYIRRAGKSDYTPLSLQHLIPGSVWETQISAVNVSFCGLEYYVCVFQGPQTTVFPSEGNLNPDIISVFIPHTNFPEKTREETYQMISIPFATGDHTLGDLFKDDLGDYDPARYRIFDCLDGVNYSELTELDKTWSPGRALWLISKDSTDLDVEDVYSFPSGQPYVLTLNKGWNMISTPFAFPVDWKIVTSGPALRYFDGTDWIFASVLEPFKGYAVYVPEQTILPIPVSETDLQKPAGLAVPIPTEGSWYFQVQGSAGGAKDSYNFAGAALNSAAGLDRYDHPDPPPIGKYVRLSLRIPDQELSFSSDFRATGEEGYRFDIALNSTVSQTKHIRFVPYHLPQEFNWTVVDPSTQVIYGKNEILTDKQMTSYQLIVGSEKFIEQSIQDYHALPKSFHISQNFPNPFNPLTTIKFQLPRTQRLTIIIYDLLGREVKYLLHDTSMEAGYHQLRWDGTDKTNHNVSSGIYFLHFKSEDHIKTLKMVLQR